MGICRQQAGIQAEARAGIPMGRAGMSSISIRQYQSLEVQSHVIRDAEIPSSNSGQTALSCHMQHGNVSLPGNTSVHGNMSVHGNVQCWRGSRAHLTDGGPS